VGSAPFTSAAVASPDDLGEEGGRRGVLVLWGDGPRDLLRGGGCTEDTGERMAPLMSLRDNTFLRHYYKI
jgi:hypothetical protein